MMSKHPYTHMVSPSISRAIVRTLLIPNLFIKLGAVKIPIRDVALVRLNIIGITMSEAECPTFKATSKK